MVKAIPLTQGYEAIVGDEDYEELAKHRWHVQHKGNTSYARRDIRTGPRSTLVVFMHGQLVSPPHGYVVDHINRNGLDNRRQNLRVCTQAENMRNRAANRNGSSPFKGVSWHKTKHRWFANIWVDGRLSELGGFMAEIDAARVYNVAALFFFGEYARLNEVAPMPDQQAEKYRQMWQSRK